MALEKRLEISPKNKLEIELEIKLDMKLAI